MLLHRNEILFRQGEYGPLYRLHSGLLKIVRVQEDGRQLVLNFIVPGEVIPHHSLISPKAYHGTAIALMTGTRRSQRIRLLRWRPHACCKAGFV
jgi:CRP-like cAMP-binding protein